MDWIQTWSGRVFRPLDPSPGEIDIRDIAHALSLLCRFNGHCLAFYSVAEHSLRVSQQLPPEQALSGLLHDAAEAYISDLPSPIKRLLPAFSEAEDRLLRIIARRFELCWPVPEAVWQADKLLLATEQRDLMHPPPAPWDLDLPPLPARIEPLEALEAERLFLARFHELR